ncbi:A-kinase anchor protein 4 [Ambystoma mexicanum]|uniref:A-kinase anchor protein 4 n=1 Tax=Ambystoma mexicanum TaxID=8296 RepID=UPI0037E87C64
MSTITDGDWLYSNNKLCSIDFNIPVNPQDTGIREISFIDVSDWNKPDPDKPQTGARHDYTEIMATLPEGGLDDDEIVLTNFTGTESKEKDTGAAFLFTSTKDRVYDKNSIFCDLEKYKLGFQHALKLMGYKYKWEINTCLTSTAPIVTDTAINAYSSYTDWLANEIFNYILNGMKLHFESEETPMQDDYCIGQDQKEAIYRGFAASVDEVALYATGLSSVVLYTASQEAAKRKEQICYPQGAAAASTAVEKYASNLSEQIVKDGTKEASVILKEMERVPPPEEQPPTEPENVASAVSLEGVVSTCPVAKEEAAPGDTPIDQPVPGSVHDQPPQTPSDAKDPGSTCVVPRKDTCAVQAEPYSIPPEEPCSDSMVVMVKYLFLEFRPNSECNYFPPGDSRGFLMTEFDFATLLKWGIMRYASQVASRLIDSIMNHLYATLEGKSLDTSSECMVESPGVASENRQELVKLYMKLYAERLSLRILKEVLGPCYEKSKYNEFVFQPTPCSTRPSTAMEPMDVPPMVKVSEVKEAVSAVHSVCEVPQPEPPPVEEVAVEPPPVAVSAVQSVCEVPQPEPTPVEEVAAVPECPPVVQPPPCRDGQQSGTAKRSVHEFNEKLIENMLHYDCPVKPVPPKCPQEVTHLAKRADFSLDNLKNELDPAIKYYCSTVSEFLKVNPGGVIDFLANQAGLAGIDVFVDHLTETGVSLDSISEARMLARPLSTEGECRAAPPTPTPRKGWTVRILSSTPLIEASEVLVSNQNAVYDGHARQLQAVLQWAAASQLGVPKMYFTEVDDQVLARLPEVSQKAAEIEFTVGSLLQAVLNFHQGLENMKRLGEAGTPVSLLDWLCDNL